MLGDFFWISILIQKQPLEYNIIHSQEIMLNFQYGIVQDRKSTDPQCQAMKKKAKAAIVVYDCSNETSLFCILINGQELVFQAGSNVKIALIGINKSKKQFWLEQNRLRKLRHKRAYLKIN
ncbi:unnamed protein product [Paramecium primaurelia]|uniref:Uncharacterized protein n=1 Tax=Paramecium primaurelia TaxID=5886 RepID=A0A8S1NMW2_PARPR|nr:unnamed protein product [Paramecium primaurelia]